MALNTTGIGQEELQSLVPHKGKMFLLSRITGYDIEAGTLQAEYDITENCIFYDPAIGGLPSWVSFEFMAQSISALSGLIGRSKGHKPRPGFILSVSNLVITQPVLQTGATVQIRVWEDYRTDMVFTFNCEVLLENKSAATVKLTVMEAADISHLKKTGEKTR
ncbi:MAG: 3-hydroxylacyl-ACP dehydratase [Treponema sp.]|jgi:predicted hotdog family 3-hydroxylacyl-ACP dehydratase|nr:3-hydroxylacyl-ACP dehydratase [Treponema sp.]